MKLQFINWSMIKCVAGFWLLLLFAAVIAGEIIFTGGCGSSDTQNAINSTLPTSVSNESDCATFRKLTGAAAQNPNQATINLETNSPLVTMQVSQDCIGNAISEILREIDIEGSPPTNDYKVNELRLVGIIAARKRVGSTLPLLVEHVSIRGTSYGFSDAHFPLHDPLVAFGSDAIPFLNEKFKQSNELERDLITRVLVDIRKTQMKK